VCWKTLTILAESETVFRFFPARQVHEIIFNEYLRNTENALIKWLRKRDQTQSKYTWFLSLWVLSLKRFLESFYHLWFVSIDDVFKLQEEIAEHGIRVFIENGLLILQIWDKADVLKTFQKQFLKLDSKLKKPLWFRKMPCGLFPKPLKERIFSVSGLLIKDYLRNLTCWKISKNRFGLSASK
jgi:hypothetical protein